MAIYRGPGGAGDATVDATNAAAEVALKTQEAVDAATAAAASAAEAAASAVIASDGLDGIAAYADAAFGSAADALASETNAADSEANAAISEANAAASAAAAALSEDNAAISEANANEDASTATTKAAEAADSADEAAASAAAALISQNSAASSALDAANSAAAAEGYLPSFTGNNGKYLKTNGTSALWATVDALPSQTGNSGKYLTTNGTAASWVPLSVDAASPTVTGTVFGRTDSGIYSPPAVVDVRPIADSDYPGGFSDTAHTIHINSTSLYQSRPGNQLFSAIAAGTIQVGMSLSIICVVSATGLKTTVNLGTITNISYYYDGYTYATITFSGTLDTTGLSRADLWGNYLFHIWDFVLGGTIAENVTLGQNAGVSLTTGGENVIIGANAGNSINAGRNNVVIGNAADSSATSVSNEITLGNSSHTKTRLFGALAVGGSSTGTSGQVLTSNGSGSAPSWTTAGTGTVTSVALSAPTGLTVTGSPVTTSGTLALTYTAGYSIPTDTKQTNWDTAYGWGNHASAGYLTSATAASTYAPLTGTGTSGTWGISITGNAATVTNGLYSTGSYSNPTWLTSVSGSIVSGNISGNAANVTGTVAIANGGTGQATQQAAINALTGTQSAGTYLRSDGTNASLSTIQAADVPTLNQNTTGTAANITATSNSTLTTLSALSLPGSQVSGNISGNAANVTGTVAVANGGTGSTTLTANNVLLGNGTSALQVVAPGTNGNVLTSNGTTWVSSAPASSGISTGKSIAMAMIFGF